MNEVRKKLQLGFAALALVGIAGVVFILLQTMRPTENAVDHRPYFEIDISEIPEGGARAFEWREQPFWIVRPSQVQFESMQASLDLLREPTANTVPQGNLTPTVPKQQTYARPLVVSRLSSISPCGVEFQKQASLDWPQHLRAGWQGGFVDHCSSAVFDLAGRVYKSSRAEAGNLRQLAYKLSGSRLRIEIVAP